MRMFKNLSIATIFTNESTLQNSLRNWLHGEEKEPVVMTITMVVTTPCVKTHRVSSHTPAFTVFSNSTLYGSFRSLFHALVFGALIHGLLTCLSYAFLVVEGPIYSYQVHIYVVI